MGFQNKKSDFEDPVLKNRVSKQLNIMSLSTSVGMFSVLGFNLADTFYIGQLGVNELAAISYTSPIIFSLSALTLGLGIGVSVVISKVKCNNSRLSCAKICSYGILLSLLLVTFFSMIGILTMEPLFEFLGAKDESLKLVQEYMFIWYLSLPFSAFSIIGNSAIRGLGVTKLPSLLMLFSSVLNLILDPIFIFGYGSIPNMGIAGAGLASFLSKLISTILFFYVLHKKYALITVLVPVKKELFNIWKQILNISLPAGSNRIITPIALGITTKIIANHGQEAVAAFGVVSRIESMSLIFITSLAAVIAPFIGKNLSSNYLMRVSSAVNYSIIFCLFWGILNATMFLFIAEPISSLFSDNKLTIEYASLYLNIVPLSLTGLALLMITSASCNPLNKPYLAIRLTVMRIVILYIPLTTIGSFIYGFEGIVYGITISNIVAGIVSTYSLIKLVSVYEKEVSNN